MSHDNPQPSDVVQQSLDLEAHCFFEDEEPDEREREDVIRMLRRDSSNAYLCGRSEELQRYIDDLIGRLEREEHHE